MLQTTNRPLSPATERTFFGVLFRCVLVSCGLMLGATATKLDPLLTMLLGVAPLVWYHLFYLAKRARLGLGQTAIDSVYYFGFLITIAALGLSAITLAYGAGAASLTHVAFQFGLGLLATGYAVIARMHLTSISTYVDDASPENVLDRYVHRSRELVTNVELASTQFVELSNSLMLKSQEVANTARTSTEKVMLEVARAFDQELRGALASARAGLTEVRSLASEAAFAQERETLARSLRETIASTTAANEALQDLASRAKASASATEGGAIASAALTKTLDSFRSNIERIGGDGGSMVASAESLAKAQAVLSEGVESLSASVRELGEVSIGVGGVSTTFRSIKSLTQKAHEQLDALITSTSKLDQSTAHLERSANAMDALALNVDRFSGSMPSLGEKTLLLVADLGRLSGAVTAIERELAALPQPTREATQLSTELKDAIGGIQSALVSASANGERLVAQADAQSRAFEKAANLAQQASGMSSAGDSIHKTLTELSNAVEHLHSRLSTSTETLTTAISSATNSLESDVKRSTEAASMFGSRLTNVAQILIDHTQARPS